MSDIDDVLDDEPSEPSASPKTQSHLITADASGIRRFQGFVIPHEAQRIRVHDVKGKVKLRKFDELQTGDTAVLNDKGLPIFIEGVVGHPGASNTLALPPASPIVGDIIKLKQGHLRADPIINSLIAQPDSPDVLQQVNLGMAEEIASLRWEKLEAERQGKETSAISMRRIQGLQSLATNWLKRQEQTSGQIIDLESDAFQALFQFLSETFAKAMQNSNVRQEMIDTVISQFVKLLSDDWRTEAISRMKAK